MLDLVDKKQIKADANFAYGLIHYFYGNSGANKNLGIQYIKKELVLLIILDH